MGDHATSARRVRKHGIVQQGAEPCVGRSEGFQDSHIAHVAHDRRIVVLAIPFASEHPPGEGAELVRCGFDRVDAGYRRDLGLLAAELGDERS
ncbi:MAG TPA: hypothetical protein VI168_09175 [Croceibacterium sp.]